jgi:hypothetical protein
VGKWIASLAATVDSIKSSAGRTGRKKIRTTPFGDENGRMPFNASGVVQLGPGRFVFIDNNDPSALFELTLLADGTLVERISRRPLVGLVEGQLLDPEGLTVIDLDGEAHLIVASSFCLRSNNPPDRHRVNDGLVRIRYTPRGDLYAEAMAGFRTWLLEHQPSLAKDADREPDSGGLNIEGVAWDPRTRTLLFGLRGPADRGRIAVVRVPLVAGGVQWATSAFGAPSIRRVRVPQSRATQGIRDISYDEQTGDFLIVLGRWKSNGKEPFQLCTWNGTSEQVRVLDVEFHKSVKPEGVCAFSGGARDRLFVVDDRGGYAVVDRPNHLR